MVSDRISCSWIPVTISVLGYFLTYKYHIALLM